MADSFIQSRKHAARHAHPLFAAMAAVALGTSAQAQTPTGDAGTLPTVEVQGEADAAYKPEKLSSPKFTKPVLDTPQTISVIKEQVIEEQNATTLQEALRNTPGVTVLLGENGNSNAKDNIFMRGFDASGSIFLDGVRDLGSAVRDTFNIEQIEVLKGASGSEYGRGAAAGTVNLSTKTPKLDNAGEARVSAGSASNKRATLDLNRAFSETGAFRLNLMAQDSGVAGRDFVKNKGYGLAPSVAFGLGTPTRVIADLIHVRFNNRPDGGVPTVGLPGYYNAALAGAGVRGIRSVDPSNFYGSLSDYSKTKADQATLRVEHDFSPDTTLRNVTRAGRSNIDQLITGVSGVVSDTVGSNTVPRLDPATWTASRSRQLRWQENTLVTNQTNVTTKFSTGAVQHAFSGGLELIHEKQTTRGRAGAGTMAPANLYAPNVNDLIAGMAVVDSGQVSKGTTNTVALYAFDSMTLSPQWQLDAGLRADRYRTTNDNVTAPDAAGAQTRTHLKASDTLLSGKLGVIFKPAPNGSVYASVSTSQLPPGGSNFTLSATEGNINNAAMDPSKATNLELGTKWEVLDKRLLLTGALFRTTVNNDLGAVDAVTGEVTQFGKKRVQGLELSAVGQITPAWHLSTGLASMSTKVSEGTATQTGSAINWSPKLTFTAWTTYSFDNGLTVGGGARYMDSMVRSISNTATAATTNMLSTPDYWVFDAYLGYKVNKNVDLQLNVYNLANKKYIASLNNSGARYIPGATRSVLLTANIKF